MNRILNTDESVVSLMKLQSDLLIEWVGILTDVNINAPYVSQIQVLYEKIQYSVANKRNIFFTGIGKNVPMLIKTTNTMNALSMNAFTFNAVDAIHGDMGVLKENDLLIAVSRSGNTEELAIVLKLIKQYKPLVQTFSVSMNTNTEMEKYTKYSVNLPAYQEMDSWNQIPTVSPLAFQTLFDSIALKIAYEHQFSPEQYHANHSGGQIGDELQKLIEK